MMFNDLMHQKGNEGNGNKENAVNIEVEEHGGALYMKDSDGNLHITGEKGLNLSSPEFDIICGGRGACSAVIDGAKGLYSSFVKSTGGIGAWFRFSDSNSISGGFKTKLSFRWGSNKYYREQIGNPTLRKWNERLRNTKLPENKWRVNDPRHYHIIKKRK